MTRYEYTGSTTKVTDPAGKWKKQTTDALGHLTTVTEPNPAGGADWTTTYWYNTLDKLVRVALNDDAILARSGLALVGIATEVNRLAGVFRDEAPLQTGRKSRAAPAA